MNQVRDIRQAIGTFAQEHRRSGLALAACAALGMVASLLTLQGSLDERELADNWSLPAARSLELRSDVTTMLAEPLFGGEPVVIAEPEPEKPEKIAEGDPWSLAGIVFEGTDKSAVLLNQTLDKLQRFRVGDTLPGGEMLVDIRANSILFEFNDERIEQALFKDATKVEE